MGHADEQPQQRALWLSSHERGHPLLIHTFNRQLLPSGQCAYPDGLKVDYGFQRVVAWHSMSRPPRWMRPRILSPRASQIISSRSLTMDVKLKAPDARRSAQQKSPGSRYATKVSKDCGEAAPALMANQNQKAAGSCCSGGPISMCEKAYYGMRTTVRIWNDVLFART